MHDDSTVQIELKYLLDRLLNCWYFVRVYRLRIGVREREKEREREREREEEEEEEEEEE